MILKIYYLYISIISCFAYPLFGQQKGGEELSPASLNDSAAFYYDIDFNKTIKFASLALDKSIGQKDSLNLGVGYFHLGNAFEAFTNYEQSQKYFGRALEVFERVGAKQKEAETLNNIGLIYWYLNDLERAVVYYQAALQIGEELQNQNIKSNAFNRLGLAHTMMHHFDSASFYYEEMLTIEKEQKDSVGLAKYHNNLGILYQEQGLYAEAIPFFNNSLSIKKWVERPYGIAESYNNMAYSYLNLGDLDRAESYLDSAMHTISKHKISSLLLDWYRYAALLKKAHGNVEASFDYYELYLNIQDSILKSRRGQKVQELMAINTIDDMERDLVLKEEQLRANILLAEKNQWIRNVTIAFAVVFMVLAFLIVNRQRALINKKETLARTEQKLNHEKLKSADLEKRHLNHQLQFKQKEITNLALHIAEKNKTLRLIQNKLSNAIQSNDVSLLQEVRSELELQLKSGQDVAMLNHNIETLYSNFLYNLKSKYANLSANELRLCCQLCLNLSSKEISVLNHISVKSVEVARYRLRKKLGLDKDDNLTDFLQNL